MTITSSCMEMFRQPLTLTSLATIFFFITSGNILLFFSSKSILVLTMMPNCRTTIILPLNILNYWPRGSTPVTIARVCEKHQLDQICLYHFNILIFFALPEIWKLYMTTLLWNIHECKGKKWSIHSLNCRGTKILSHNNFFTECHTNNYLMYHCWDGNARTTHKGNKLNSLH